MSGFERLLEAMVPGMGHLGMDDADSPVFPLGLGLEPEGVIARGGSGWVVRARDVRLNQRVAVKISRQDAGPQVRDVVLEEAQITALLQGPGVLAVHNVVDLETHVCVVFQLAPEKTLADVDGMDRESTLTLLYGVLVPLIRAHEAGVFHGDLHPRNVAFGSITETYVLDWGGGSANEGEFAGHPGYAAPELLGGGSPTEASDVYSWGVMAWELFSGSALRSSPSGETLGEAVLRWRDEALPPAPKGLEPEVVNLLLAALASDPEERPSAEALKTSIHEILTGQSERVRRYAESKALVARRRIGLDEYRDCTERLQDEQRVVAVQRMKIMDWADSAQKRPLWDAEDRLKQLVVEQEVSWVRAVEEAFRAWTLSPENREARSLLADLWWLRFRQHEMGGALGEIQVSLERIRQFDDGRYARILDGDAHVSLKSEELQGRVRIEAFVERDRVLERVLYDEVDFPLERYELEPGSWLFTIEVEGKEPLGVPIALSRREHHRAEVALWTESEVGEGWVYVAGGAFKMGGDPIARQVAWKAGGRGPLRTFRSGGDPLAKEAVEACSPTVRGCFVMRSCVRSGDYLAFLNDIEVETAKRHVPGEAGLTGKFRPYWNLGERWKTVSPEEFAVRTAATGRWSLPADWDPDWPVVAVSVDDVVAYAQWLSERLGRPVRLPTEEEWEKAARGVDARAFPWGGAFDPTFAHMRRSQPGVPGLWPVGRYPVDCSVYGCMDMAGGVREWTASMFSEGQVVVRGGGWNDDMDELRCAGRRGLPRQFRSSSVGFRLVSEEPSPTTGRE